MLVNIISWNVRGLNRIRKRRVINSLILRWKTEIICFQESKLEGDIREKVKELWGNRWVKFAQLQASGTRGGIVVMWDGRMWKGKVCCVGAHTITCKFSGKTQDYSWHLSAVYAPNNRRKREEVWWELASARGLFDGPWVVCRNFNTVRFPLEKKNYSRFTRAMTEFSNFIEDMELVDPIIRDWDPIKSYFKFENWWLQTEGFKNRVQEWRNSFTCEGRLDLILVSKLKALKAKLKEWSKTLQGNLALQKTNILSQLAELEEIHDQRSLTGEEIFTKTSLTMEFEEIVSHEEVA
ncbi:uncharacterized protein [Nicotiana tomentosiformis]|uniref:uncharacterized protein n=1 Tax=Nicotiana tomentosiformis TaxID=4098 RepID=UPI00388CE6BA